MEEEEPGPEYSGDSMGEENEDAESGSENYEHDIEEPGSENYQHDLEEILPEPTMDPRLYKAIVLANLDDLRIIINVQDFDPGQVDQWGRNSIAVNCVCAGHDRENGDIRATILRELADKRVDCLNVDMNGWRSIHSASSVGCPEIVSVLVELGSDIDARAVGSDRTPLHIAASRGWDNCVQTLLSAGADTNLMDSDGLVPAESAFMQGFRRTQQIITNESDRRFEYHQRVEHERQRFLAFCMAHQERIGAGSVARMLNPESFRLIVGGSQLNNDPPNDIERPWYPQEQVYTGYSGEPI